MKLKPKDVTYIGIHNRKTDFDDFMRQKMKFEDMEELGEEFFLDGMEYFRYIIYFGCLHDVTEA